MNEDPDLQIRRHVLAQQWEVGVLLQKAGGRQSGKTDLQQQRPRTPFSPLIPHSLLYGKKAFEKTRSWAPDLNGPIQSTPKPNPHGSIQGPEDNCEAQVTLLQLKQM